MDFIELGASLYLPATMNNLTAIASGSKYPRLRSVIFCTEDAIKDFEVDSALDNIQACLNDMKHNMPEKRPYCFIRPRSPEVLQRILNMENIHSIQGFALPKFTLENMPAWFSILEKHPQFFIMPILESLDTFCLHKMTDLRDAFLSSPQRNSIAAIRIGGLDLLNLLGVRRQPEHTIYDTALSFTLKSLATIFIPYGFILSAPVFECIDAHETLRKEVELDLLHGFYLKSIIHPMQIDVVENAYKVKESDLETAAALAAPENPAVFRMYGCMSEKTTHLNWAQKTQSRAQIYGLK